MYSHPGKKMLFMGAEVGQRSEWNCDSTVEWNLLQYEPHEKLMKFLANLNDLYSSEPAMHELDFEHTGFEWLDFSDSDSCVISFMRRAKDPADFLVFVFNFTPIPRMRYKVGVPLNTSYREILNSDSELYYGSNVGNAGLVVAEDNPFKQWPYSISLDLPPLGMVVLKPERK
jgi:1,4-alpha-glucan branching enzyme